MTSPDRAPDILYIMTDQLRADWLGCYGHPVVRTPNIDALAARGTRFDDFHVASPVCMPNRASFMTGRYPSLHGLRNNGCVLSERANTFVDVLRAGGYRTASIGKSHLQPFTDIAPHAWDVETGPVTEAWKDDPEDYACEEPDSYTGAEPYRFPTPYYGFDHVEMVTSHGDRAGGHYRQWFRQAHPDWRVLTDPANQLPHDYTCPQAYRTPIPEDSYPTAWIRDRAANWLDANAGSAAPLFTYVSFPDPHHPFNPPGRYWDMYRPEDFGPAVRFEDHRNPPPPLLAARRDMELGIPPRTPQSSFMAPDRQIAEAMALTAGMIAMIDDAVGMLVQALKDAGRYDNTIVVFNSDHGDYLGDFNLLLKGAWSSDAITRVPMIWADPRHPDGRVDDALASTVDIAPTVLQAAGLLPYFGIQGQSLLPGADGVRPVRDAQLVEFNDLLPRQGFERPARVRSLLTGDWRLNLYRDQRWGELYDRRADPRQTCNLWDDPAHRQTRAGLTERLAHELIAQMDESPRPKRLA